MLIFLAAFDANTFLQSTGKGKVVHGVVEQVANGAMLRVTLLPTYQNATVVLCGVQAPSMGRKAVEGTEGPSAASIAAASNAEPFAYEAKHLTESRALNRSAQHSRNMLWKFGHAVAANDVTVTSAPIHYIYRTLISYVCT